MNENDNAARPATPNSSIPTPDEARDWLKESGITPDLSVTWKVTEEPGSAERHLALLKMLFGPKQPPRAA